MMWMLKSYASSSGRHLRSLKISPGTGRMGLSEVEPLTKDGDVSPSTCMRSYTTRPAPSADVILCAYDGGKYAKSSERSVSVPSTPEISTAPSVTNTKRSSCGAAAAAESSAPPGFIWTRYMLNSAPIGNAGVTR